MLIIPGIIFLCWLAKVYPTFKISNILRLWPQTGTFLSWLLIVVDGKLGMDVSGEEKKDTRCRAPYWNPCRPSAGLQPQAWYHTASPFLLKMPFGVLFPESRDYNCVWIFTFSNPFLKTKWDSMDVWGRERFFWLLATACVGRGQVTQQGKGRSAGGEQNSHPSICFVKLPMRVILI